MNRHHGFVHTEQQNPGLAHDSPEQIANIKAAYKILYRSGLTLAEAKVQLVAAASAKPELKILSEFLVNTTRGIVR